MNKLINIRKMFLTFSLIGLLAMSCAPSANQVSATQVSPVIYQAYDCDMLLMEQQIVETNLANLITNQNKVSKHDGVVVGLTVGLGFVFLGLLGLAGLAGLSSAKKTDKSDELAQLKGQSEAIKKALMLKGGCN